MALVLKRHGARAGLDPAEVAGRSLRTGLATSAAAAGVPKRVIAEQTGHKGTAMLRRYIREGFCSGRTPPARLGCSAGKGGTFAGRVGCQRAQANNLR
ncbi:MAG: hypothetical protein ABSA65_17485 [Acidimicrobiales bacterium]